MVNLSRAGIASVVMACSVTSVAVAQAPAGGSIRGVVYDKEFNAPISGATVSVLGLKAKVTTRENGSYILPNIAPGAYTLVITKDGYTREVKANVPVAAGQLVDADVTMAGEFEDMEEFVVQDVDLGKDAPERQDLVVPTNFEPYVIIPPIEFSLRLEAPQLLDTIGVEMISRSGAGDAAAALLMVPGATLQDGKYAVIRGLPDRYVATLLDGIRLPSADPNKRAVKLDQFPSAVIQGIQVSKNFTPDQQGEASGGAVNISLKDFPDEFYFRVQTQVGFNSQVKDGEFLNYKGGDLGFWGNNDVLTTKEELNGQSWPDNPTSTEEGAAPLIYKWQAALGNSWEVDDGVKVGAFGNFFYEQDASAYDNGQLNSLEQAGPGTAIVPERYGTGDNFKTELYDVTQGTSSVQWGGMGSLGIETDEHKLGAKFLYTLLSENQSIRLIDTRGKDYFFPGYNPDDITGVGHDQPDVAPYNRLETLDYSQLSTESVILSGQHKLSFLDPNSEDSEKSGVFDLLVPTVDWKLALSKAREDQPDQTQFASYWLPAFQVAPGVVNPQQWIAYPPAQNAFVGWVQHINYTNEEQSQQGSFNVKLPFMQWDDREGYIKTGSFLDLVSRTYRQDTFSNGGDPNTSYSSAFNEPWSAVFPSQDHPIYQSETDISYDGTQDIWAAYAMIDLPVSETFNIITGLRYEGTHMSTTVLPDADALWIDTDTQQLRDFSGTNDWDADFTTNRYLPMVGCNWILEEGLIFRAAFAQTLARPNFYELVPVLQYDYIGGPIFIGNPALQMSSLNNYDLRLDWTPYENWLISSSLFYKTISDPIQYVNRFTEGFAYTSALNFPEGTLLGAEFEARVTLEPMFGENFRGIALGSNFTYMSSEVTLSKQESDALATYGVKQNTQPMTATPDYLMNVSATYDYDDWGTQLGIFYTMKGDSLISGANPHTNLLTPAIYQIGYGTLNFTASQEIFEGLKFSINARNLTNPDVQTEYRTTEGINGLNSTYSAGIAVSFALTYQVNF